ncbi:hypothetical protein LMG7974_00426 [Campylobacter majalis]|uniref:Rhodanese domain-containing protein n=1 Tax=Campylobacter majalis TaxID=2790656 RepID=A0ABN7K581_9BACT|nr:rhodanese-like domain-containing protein [Campylobacter majalis]CAD7287547.1 hypothetical protein LMG7974_00426 [Campylobacter majalis]
MKYILSIFIFVSLAFSQITTLPATVDNISKIQQIIDIRTPEEWRETGIIEGAHTLTLVQNKEIFWNKIMSMVDTSKPFALICRSGKRSALAAKLIDKENLDIINLDGGMNYLIHNGYKTTPYKD